MGVYCAYVWPKEEHFGPAGSSVRGRNGSKLGGEQGGNRGERVLIFGATLDNLVNVSIKYCLACVKISA